MKRLFVLRSHHLVLSVSLFWFLVGCSKPTEPTASIEQQPVNDTKDANEQDPAGEPQMGRRPKHGFKEYVKNPNLFRKESQEFDEVNDVLPPTEMGFPRTIL
jgi:hypothetical protein